MKTKLLKKVRRRFVINFYPNREEHKRFRITDLESEFTFYYKQSYSTKQECLDALIYVLRSLYGTYSRKYKQSQISSKVWYKNKK